MKKILLLLTLVLSSSIFAHGSHHVDPVKVDSLKVYDRCTDTKSYDCLPLQDISDEVDNRIAKEAYKRNEADVALNNKVEGEISDRQAGDQALQEH